MTTVTRSGIIIIPKQYTPNWDITVGGINIDNELVEIEINRLVSEGTGNFTMTLLNPANMYDFKGMEPLVVNADFGSASAVLFKGTVEEVKKVYDDVTKIRLNGRHISGELADLTVTEAFANTELSVIFKSLVTTYAPSYTVSNVNETLITDSISFDHVPFFQALRDLAYRANFDFYVDNNKDFHFFEAGSIVNNSESIGPTYFLTSDGLGDSVVEIKNRIIVYGNTSSGLPIIYTVDDTDSQALYNVREKFINDSRIISVDIAKMVANAYLSFNKNKNKIGTVASLGLPTLLPGDKIYIENHTVGISGQFRISHTTDRIGDEGWHTTVTAERIGSVRFSAIFRDIARGGTGADFKNPNKMKYSKTDEFDGISQIESTVNANTSNSFLVQTAVGTNGVMVSTVTSTSFDITKCEMRATGQDLNASTFEVSTDNGANWAFVSLNNLVNLSTGRQLKVRITLVDNSSNVLPRLDGFSLLYR